MCALLKRLLTIMSLVLIVFIAVSCTSQKNITKKDQVEDTILKKIQSYKLNESNYLLFVESPTTANKKITLFLPYSVDNMNIKEISLIQDNEQVTNKTTVNSPNILDNKLYFTLNEFIPSFNKAQLTLDNGRTIIINTGQYILQKYISQENIPENKLKFLDSGNFQNKLGKITYSAQFNYKEKSAEQDVDIILPDDLISLRKTIDFIQVSVSDTLATFKLGLSFPKSEFTKLHVNSLTFEVLWFQKYSDKNAVILIGSIPITFNDYR